MLIDPNLTLTEIKEKIAVLEPKVDEVADVGDEFSSMGTTVKNNNRYNHYKAQLQQLYSMKSSKIRRGA